jgi:hypothetical protein
MVCPDLTISLVDFKVVSFEGRRAELMESLIRQHGGECFNAPSEMAVVGRPRSCAEATVKHIGLLAQNTGGRSSWAAPRVKGCARPIC